MKLVSINRHSQHGFSYAFSSHGRNGITAARTSACVCKLDFSPFIKNSSEERCK